METMDTDKQITAREEVIKPRSLIDSLVYLAAIVGPLMTLPQVYEVWIERSKGASFITWSSYIVVAMIWLAYGIKHKDKPIITLQVLWLILDILIVVGLAVLH